MNFDGSADWTLSSALPTGSLNGSTLTLSPSLAVTTHPAALFDHLTTVVLRCRAKSYSSSGGAEMRIPAGSASGPTGLVRVSCALDVTGVTASFSGGELTGGPIGQPPVDIMVINGNTDNQDCN